jgi:hypothetical protein
MRVNVIVEPRVERTLMLGKKRSKRGWRALGLGVVGDDGDGER